MSEIRIGNGINNPHQINEQPKISTDEKNAPQELAGAKPSKLVTALRVIACIFTVGISEGIIYLVNKFSKSDAQANQVNPHNADMLPNAKPHADLANSQLDDLIKQENIPDNVKNALEDVATGYRKTYGEKIIPNDLYDLLNERTNDGRSISYLLRNQVRESNQEITPENIKPIFENIIKGQIKHFLLKQAILTESKSSGIEFKAHDLNEVSRKILSNMKGNQQLAGIQGPEDAANLIANNPTAKYIVLKQQCLHILSKENIANGVFPENNPAVQGVKAAMAQFQADYGAAFKVDNLKDMLNMTTKEGVKLASHLLTFLNDTISPTITADFIKNEIIDTLSNVVKNDILTNGIKTKIEQAGLLYSQTFASDIISSLQQSSQGFNTALNEAKSSADISNLLVQYDDLIDKKINEIKVNITEMENKYLPSVADEVKPLFKIYLSTLMFDDAHKAESEKRLKTDFEFVKHWKNMTSSTDFEGYQSINESIKKDLSYLEGTHDEGEASNIYVDNVHSQFVMDSGRGTYVLNGQQIERKADAVVNAFKNEFQGKDLQFLTKLCNQRLQAPVLTSMGITTMPNMPDLKLKVDGEPLPQAELQSSFVHYNATSMAVSDNHLADVTLDMGHQTYDVMLSEDKKTGSLVFTRKEAVNLLNPKKTLGTLGLTIKVNFTLASGSENGVPYVNNVEYGQKFGNPF